MRCPYCRTELGETTAGCPGCKLDLAKAVALLGPVPRLEQGVSDDTQALSEKQKGRLRKRITEIERRFPQISIQVTCHGFPTDHPFSLYVFWIFNTGGISLASRKGGDNHTILLALDPIEGRSAIMLGYGLEPFVPETALDHLLEIAEPAWIDQAWAEGIAKVLDGLEPLLESAIRETGASFDLPISPEEARLGEF